MFTIFFKGDLNNTLKIVVTLDQNTVTCFPGMCICPRLFVWMGNWLNTCLNGSSAEMYRLISPSIFSHAGSLFTLYSCSLCLSSYWTETGILWTKILMLEYFFWLSVMYWWLACLFIWNIWTFIDEKIHNHTHILYNTWTWRIICILPFIRTRQLCWCHVEAVK